MSDQELIDYYANLLIIQYIGQPKAYAMIQALVTPVIMNQIPISVQNAFNLITGILGPVASGVQLDVIGKYAGVTRSGYGFTGMPITLNDNDFLILIQMAIVQNNAGSSLSTIQDLLFQFFPGEIFVFDNQAMKLSYLINSSLGSFDLVQLFVTEKLLPKPMAVALGAIIYAPVIDRFFGFSTYEYAGVNVTPFNTYEDYHTDYPWLTYEDAIVV